MAEKSMSKAIVFYSSPDDLSRLRLDKEHRAVDQVLSRLQMPSNAIHRLHATSVNDMITALRGSSYQIVQFSGHGSEDGIWVEGETGSGVVLTPEQIVALLRLAAPQVKATIFLSCFSASAIPTLIESAPYLITVSGTADDGASIEFISAFYETFLKNGSIESAFRAGVYTLESMGAAGGLKAILSRRAQENNNAGKTLIQVFPPSGSGDSLVVDLSGVDSDLDKLGIAKIEFMDLITRKIRVHRWIFKYPKQSAILSIGPYFGRFSWTTPADPVICHQVMRLKPEVDDHACQVWSSLLVSYNDLWCAEYRETTELYVVQNRKQLERAIGEFEARFQRFFGTPADAEVIRRCLPEHFKVAKASIATNLEMAEMKLHKGDCGQCIAYLETALSGLHDLLNSLAAHLLT